MARSVPDHRTRRAQFQFQCQIADGIKVGDMVHVSDPSKRGAKPESCRQPVSFVQADLKITRPLESDLEAKAAWTAFSELMQARLKRET